MSTITYNHENTFKYKKGGVDHFIKEDIKDDYIYGILEDSDQ